MEPRSISVVMPTLNAERYLAECLAALREQVYPQERIQLLVVDAGSTDRTVEIARRYGARLLQNPLRTGEAGKAVGVKAATGDLILLLDSDNVIVGRDWLRRMTEPFADPDVVAAEPGSWDYRRRDHFINRWHALTGVADPLPLFVGNYARYSHLTGRWTDYPHREEPRDGWTKVWVDPEAVPTIGANGYLVRRDAFELVPVGDYLFDIDHAYELVQRDRRVIARVDVAIRHYYCDGVRRFYRKQRRRSDDYLYFKDLGARSYPWTGRQRRGIVRFCAATVTTVPLLAQVVRGYRRTPDPAWLWHVPASWITLAVYARSTLQAAVKPRMHDRSTWSQ